jgi:carboxyl-terminal processing protease
VTDDKPAADKAKPADADKAKKGLAEEDYQLFEALNILKGMDLVQSRLQATPEPKSADGKTL